MSVGADIEVRPERMREEFQGALVHWASMIDGIGKLLALAEVSLEDKRRLLDDLKTAHLNAVASVNGLQCCEMTAAKAAAELQKKWGWLL